VNTIQLCQYGAKLSILKLKTRPKQHLRSLPLDIALPDLSRLRNGALAGLGEELRVGWLG